MIIDDYLNYKDIYSKKYGENTIILMQVGSFFEMYSIEQNDILLYKISDICNLQVSRRNKTIIEVSLNNYLMAGFPSYTLQKYLQILLNNNYTIVLIEQITIKDKIERKITEILSKSTNINLTNKKSNYILILYFDYINEILIVGISGIDLSTGKNFIYEVASTKEDPNYVLDECYRIISIYNPVELLIISDIKLDDNIKDEIKNALNINDIQVHYKWDEYNIKKKINEQIEILEIVYKNKSLLNIIEYLNLEKINLGRTAFVVLLNFAYEHNCDIIKNLNIPEIIENNKYLNIEYNSSLQLNIINNNKNEKSLLDILNRCSTAFGSRLFKERLLNPIIDESIINKRYDEIDELLKDNKFKEISSFLNNIIDIERIKRKIILNKYNPQDWFNFNISLNYAIDALKLINNDEIINIINEIKEDYKCLNLDNCLKYNINDIKGNIFNRGINKEIDDIDDIYNNAYNNLIEITNKINVLDNNSICKIEFTERDGYYISITKKRYENILKINKDFINKFDKKLISTTGNIYKLTSKEINKLSCIIEDNLLKISNIVKDEYIKFLNSFIINNNNKLDIIINFLGNLDISCCNAKNSLEYCYYRPIIDKKNYSYINVVNLRHPIIERLNSKIEYIGNDIILDNDGLLLYGINASGKSSFMKAIGLNIVMAQSGMFVPSNSFIYSPYYHIFTRILGNDNIYKAMSSFVVEMTELRNILQRCDKNSLIIGDEICSGTEVISGVCIIASAIKEIIQKGSTYIFTSHLHELPMIIKNEIELKKIKIYHMHISIDENNIIIYDRKLKEGKGSSVYGIEVCKSLMMPKNFMKNAEAIRKELLNINNEIKNDLCVICNKNKVKEVHHINYQCLSNDNGYFDNFHKDDNHNLVKLCEECHLKEHNNKISINGYIQTTEGIKLNVDKNINEIDKLKIYIKRDKINWYSRKTKNGIFKITEEQKIIELINKITKKKLTEIDINLYNLFI